MTKLWTLAAALVVLVGCGLVSPYVTKVENLGKDQVDEYCAETPASERVALRGRLAYDNGVPRVIVNCDPDNPDFVPAP